MDGSTIRSPAAIEAPELCASILEILYRGDLLRDMRPA